MENENSLEGNLFIVFDIEQLITDNTCFIGKYRPTKVND